MDPIKALKHAMDKLSDKEFTDFKWHLKNLQMIPEFQLDKADRHKTVDLLMQEYPRDPVAVAKECLKGIHRNDLVLHLSTNDVDDDMK